MVEDRDYDFTRDVLNASVALMSILVVVITFLAVEYKHHLNNPKLAEIIFEAIMGTTGASFVSGGLALAALFQLRLKRWNSLALVFAALLAFMMSGIIWMVLHVVVE